MDMKEVERNNVVTVRQRESEMVINESYIICCSSCCFILFY